MTIRRSERERMTALKPPALRRNLSDSAAAQEQRRGGPLARHGARGGHSQSRRETMAKATGKKVLILAAHGFEQWNSRFRATG